LKQLNAVALHRKHISELWRLECHLS